MADWDRFDQEVNSSKEADPSLAKRIIQKELLLILIIAGVDMVLYALVPAVGYMALMLLIFLSPFFFAVYAMIYLVHGIKSLRKRPRLSFILSLLHIFIIALIYLIGSDSANMYNPFSLGEFLPFL